MKKEDKKKAAKPGPKARVHQELDGFEVSINEFGEIRANMNIEKINQFLNKNVDDKKLLERNDLPAHLHEDPTAIRTEQSQKAGAEKIKKKGRPKKKK